MRTLNGILALGVLVVTPAVFARDYKEEVKEPVKHTFAAGPTTLNVDNINGSVVVIGDSGTTMRVEGEKVIRADDKQELERGKREVTLDLNVKDGIAQVYVNGPFRDGGRRSDNHGFHENSDRHYEVIYNLTVHVPRSTGLQLRNVNGSVKAEETSGKLDVHTVNGGVTLTNVAGSGDVNTVNGTMTATFRESPKSDTSFKTVNGKIDVTYPANLAANLQVKTFNGSAFTDFETTALANPPGESSRRDGKFVFKAGGFQHLRVGSGGPELKFETLNGGIQIRKQGK